MDVTTGMTAERREQLLRDNWLRMHPQKTPELKNPNANDPPHIGVKFDAEHIRRRIHDFGQELLNAADRGDIHGVQNILRTFDSELYQVERGINKRSDLKDEEIESLKDGIADAEQYKDMARGAFLKKVDVGNKGLKLVEGLSIPQWPVPLTQQVTQAVASTARRTKAVATAIVAGLLTGLGR